MVRHIEEYDHILSVFILVCLPADVTMVSANSYFNFTPLLASCAVGTLEFRCAVEPVRPVPVLLDIFLKLLYL